MYLAVLDRFNLRNLTEIIQYTEMNGIEFVWPKVTQENIAIFLLIGSPYSHKMLHPFILYTCLIQLRVKKGEEPIPADIGRATPCTGRESITGPHRDKQDKQPHTLTPKDNLESSINLTCMFLDGGRKPEYPERTHAYTGRTC